MKPQKILPMVVLVLILIGCGRAMDEVALRNQAISDFNDGRLESALAEAKALPADEGDFLVGQVMVFTAMAHGGAFSLLKPHYEGMADLDPVTAGGLGPARFLAAKVFAQIYWGGRDEALNDLANSCLRLNYDAVDDCVSSLTKDATASYLSSKSNMDRVYLMEVSSIAKKLSLGDGDQSDFGFGISLVGVDNRRAASIIHDMRKKGVLDQERLSIYCEIARVSISSESLCGN